MSRAIALMGLALFGFGCADKCEQAAEQHCNAKTDEDLSYVYGRVKGSRERCVKEYVTELCTLRQSQAR